MDIRDLLIDGMDQLNDWLDGALKDLSLEQVNHLPSGKTTSIGFSSWHIVRTTDNIVNFVFQRQPPIWLAQGYNQKLGLPEVAQGTGMSLDDARGLKINDLGLLREYNAAVAKDSSTFLKNASLEWLEEVQMIKPLGEMPKWRVFRQVVMTHGFMHLGEINLIKGELGLQFSI